MRKVLLVATTTLLLGSGGVFAQPFGIEMGTPQSKLNVVKSLEDPYSYVAIPPKTHPEFESFVVVATPTQGTCVVRGIGVTHSNDKYGTEIQHAFATIRQQVDATYGRSQLNDFLQPGALWRDANEWVRAVEKHERVYQAVWEGTLANNVVQILLTTGALDNERSYLKLQFHFTNFGACDAERKTINAKVF